MNLLPVVWATLFVGMWMGFSVLGIRKKWSSTISFGGGFIVSLVSMFPFLLSYAVLVNKDSTTLASIILIGLIIPITWGWIRLFSIETAPTNNAVIAKDKSKTESNAERTAEIPLATDAPVNQEVGKQHVLRELKKHKEHYDMATCLDCGYEGIAGVVGVVAPWYVSWWIIVPLLFTGIGVVGGLILGLFRASQVKRICECPQCGSNDLIG